MNSFILGILGHDSNSFVDTVKPVLSGTVLSGHPLVAVSCESPKNFFP